MLEFFAAVHAVRDRIRKAKRNISDLVRQLGVDGDYARFWPFVSGLLSGEECELLLSALADNVDNASLERKTTQHFLLLLQCHVECAGQLPDQGSPSVTALLKSIGLQLKQTHLSFSDTFAAAEILQRYGTLLTMVTLHESSMDDGGGADFLAGLQECTRLKQLSIGALSNLISNPSGLRRVLEQNKASLSNLAVPVSDAGLLELLPAIKMCTTLRTFHCGSPQLTNESAPTIAEVLRHLPVVESVALHGRMDDSGFVKLEDTLCNMANRLKRFILCKTRVSPAFLSKILSRLANIVWVVLIENPIGDDGIQQVASALRQLRYLRHLHLCDIGVTWRSLAELEKVLLSCPGVRKCHLYAEKKSFLPPGEDITKVSSLTTLQLERESALDEPLLSYGYHVTYKMVFRNERSQALHLYFIA